MNAAAPRPSGGAGTQTTDKSGGDERLQWNEVCRAEWKDINCRRRRARKVTREGRVEDSDAPAERVEDCLDDERSRGAIGDDAPPRNLVGLGLSGGGIRSATFCLGLLQGMSKKGLLGYLDYLSTVSGGGYTGGWWSAWLARDERNKKQKEIFPDQEKPAALAYSEEKIEEQAIDVDGTGITSTASADPEKEETNRQEVSGERHCAGEDPVQHLRLYGNYLTPRKGALSADTWRAITIISRNLFMTWLVLLPLLVAVVLAGQLYFVLQQDAFDPTSDNYFFSPTWELTKRAMLQARLHRVAEPLLWIALWIVALICAWMINSGDAETLRKRIAGWAGAVVVFVVLMVAGLIVYGETGTYSGVSLSSGFVIRVLLWVFICAALLFYTCVVPGREGANAPDARQKREVRRNRIIRVHAKLLVALICVAAVLLFAGFSHDLINYIGNFIDSSQGLPRLVARAGGWGAVLLSVGGSIYTALKTAPSGGHDPREADKPTGVVA